MIQTFITLFTFVLQILFVSIHDSYLVSESEPRTLWQQLWRGWGWDDGCSPSVAFPGDMLGMGKV